MLNFDASGTGMIELEGFVFTANCCVVVLLLLTRGGGCGLLIGTPLLYKGFSGACL